MSICLSLASERDVTVDRPINKFYDDNEYHILVYDKGTMMFKALNDQLGNEKFQKLLRTLFDRYKFKILKGRDLVKVTSEIAGYYMNDFYNKWLKSGYSGNEP